MIYRLMATITDHFRAKQREASKRNKTVFDGRFDKAFYQYASMSGLLRVS